MALKHTGRRVNLFFFILGAKLGALVKAENVLKTSADFLLLRRATDAVYTNKPEPGGGGGSTHTN